MSYPAAAHAAFTQQHKHMHRTAVAAVQPVLLTQVTETWLCYQSGGCFLRCKASSLIDTSPNLQVSFHDTSRHRLRVPLLTDYYNFTAASLSSKGVAYISASDGAEQPSMVVSFVFCRLCMMSPLLQTARLMLWSTTRYTW